MLGRLQEPDEERVEIRLLSDAAYVEEFDMVVDELTDLYVAGEVDGPERDQMERFFFASAARREKLRVAAALKERNLQIGEGSRWWLPSKELRIAASILIVFGLAFGVWKLTQSDGQSELDKGIQALQTAYKEQRPIQARVSVLPHSPFSQKRGPETENAINDQLRRAQLQLAEAVRDKPTPEAHHWLGRAYLAQRNFDGALGEFDAALQNNPNSAPLYSDIGVAWFEKGDLNRSLESFNKALQIDPNSLAALFNRALCYEKLSHIEEAKADWRTYLERDSTSSWSSEARLRLEALETAPE